MSSHFLEETVATMSDLKNICRGIAESGEVFANDLASCFVVLIGPLAFAAKVDDSLMAVNVIPSFFPMPLSTIGALYLV